MQRRFFHMGVAACLALGLVSAMPARAQSVANPNCPGLFRQYEAMSQLFRTSTDRGRRHDSIPIQVAFAVRQLQAGNCLTFSSALAGMEMLGPQAGTAARTDTGAAIAPPIYLHAGVVTSTADDARTAAFFARQGLAMQSIGAEQLGRRIYVGPFASQGALDGARALAIQAGFAYPYPARF